VSLVSVVFCHVEISAAGPSLVRRSPRERGVFETSRMRRLGTRELSSCKKKQNVQVCCTIFCSPGYIDSFRAGIKTLIQNKRAIIRGIQ